MVIRNSAGIVFDTNEPIVTSEWFNTIDSTKPTSHVLPLAATQGSTDFRVEWTGFDTGAGIKDYSIYVSTDGGAFSPFLERTPDDSATFSGRAGHSYAFYCIAFDLAGNIEDSKTAPESSTTVVLPSCAVNVTSQIGITRSGYTYNFATGRFSQTVTVKNTGAAAVSGPIALALDSLSANAILYNGSGKTSCASPLGIPYINVSTTGLNPGASFSIVLQFTNPTKAAITYTPRVLAGNATR